MCEDKPDRSRQLEVLWNAITWAHVVRRAERQALGKRPSRSSGARRARLMPTTLPSRAATRPTVLDGQSAKKQVLCCQSRETRPSHLLDVGRGTGSPLRVRARDLEAKTHFYRQTRTCVAETCGRISEVNRCDRSTSTRVRSKRVSTRDMTRRNGSMPGRSGCMHRAVSECPSFSRSY